MKNWVALDFEGVNVKGTLYDGSHILRTFCFEANGENNTQMMMSVANHLRQECPQLLGVLIGTTEVTLLKQDVVDFGFGLYDITTSLMEELNIPVSIRKHMFATRDISEVFIRTENKATWELNYYGYLSGKQNRSQESLLSVGNGYIGVRGSLSEVKASDDHYPATYIAGMYNKLSTRVADRNVINEDFVALPNWTLMQFMIDGELIYVTNENIKELNRTLDFRSGVLTIDLLIEDARGRLTRTITQRTAAFSRMQVVAQSYTVMPLNYSATVEVISTIDANISNGGVERYKSLNSQHLTNHQVQNSAGTGYVYVETTQSHFGVFTSFKHRLQSNDVQTSVFQSINAATTIFSQYLNVGTSLTVEKIASYVTTKEVGTMISQTAIQVLQQVATFSQIVVENQASWNQNWQKVDIQVTGDLLSQKILRLHTYHLLLSASQNNEMLDASITARGLSGEAYRGHIFWDEIFILPFYNMHFPKTARQILMYRYKRLNAARENAAKHGFRGAMFPWQSGHDGGEETQTFALNPITGEWGPDYSSYQRHVSLAVAYDVWQYVHTTNDWDFMRQFGAEIMFEVARFWASKAEFNAETGRYTIAEVMGPDEFHEGYPGSHGGGVRDNAYTNIMVSWLMEKVREIGLKFGTEFPVFAQKIALTESEYMSWQTLKHKLNIVINEQGIIAQYDGYFDLKELDWEFYKNKYGNIYRMDRLLKAEGLSADDYKVAKQADTLMTFYNFDRETIEELFRNLNYQLPENYLEENLKYYLARTSHGSTLSRIVHAKLAKMIDDSELSWQLYKEALGSDYQDIQGGTTAEGIHSGVMAATLDVAITTFAGVNTRKEILEICPKLPKHWKNLKFNVVFKGVEYKIFVSQTAVEIIASQNAIVLLNGHTYGVGQIIQRIQY